ncbi:hypothetical protein LNTAR_25460 [Lentisphaera araneosa HTCC2155]|uniref:Helix-turn-helix domain-containing protein n=1 Tax=Lentisphaera araneosa HTCC2155 TaxID=313628 RepID=A6DSD4_9BACT|nr:helix-turn-helix domain-containing protein [Lentisphaera araneosa]EDM25479.1 hypothetical protein LNTAR_25460 [Lentisphaera araneosa HTCC2155]
MIDNNPYPKNIAEAAYCLLVAFNPQLTLDDIQSFGAGKPQGASLCRVKEVARELSVSEITVRRMIKDGRLKSIMIGGSIRVFQDSVNELMGVA